MTNSEIQILQFGTGNFLRAFIGSMVQDLNEKDINLNICIIQSTSSTTLQQLAAQNFNYHLMVAGIQKGNKVEQIREITCIQDGLRLPDQADKFLDFAKSPQVKWIISNVTEAGMVMAEEGPVGQFAESFAGRLTQWLHLRYQTCPQAETVILPCELLPDNGDLLKRFVLQHADNWQLPKEFTTWLDDHVIFFNSLVDRIVPGFPIHLDTKLKDDDPFLVQAEPYSFWAIQGPESSRHHLPFLDSESEVILANDIAGYGLRKVRILNATHTAMTGHGLFHGIQTVGEWISDSDREDFLMEMIGKEIIPTIKSDSEELFEYAKEVMDRFKNPFVAHRLGDISLNSIAKLKSRILPIIEDYRTEKEHYPPLLSKCLIFMILFYLRFPQKIKESKEIKSWFENEGQKLSELDSLKKALLVWLNLEWSPDFESAYAKAL